MTEDDTEKVAAVDTIEPGDYVRLNTGGYMHDGQIGTMVKIGSVLDGITYYLIECPNTLSSKPPAFGDYEVSPLDINSLSSGIDNPDHPGHRMIEIEAHELAALNADNMAKAALIHELVEDGKRLRDALSEIKELTSHAKTDAGSMSAMTFKIYNITVDTLKRGDS